MTITDTGTSDEIARPAVDLERTAPTGAQLIPDQAGRCELVGNVAMPLSRPLPRRLLGVWAHPDDEAYLSAGLMGRVIDAGGQVTVVTATRGELGSDDPDLAGSDAFALHRESELRSSLEELGVTDVRVLGYPDGGCDAINSELAVAKLVECIDEVRPEAIVTFGPDGITGHSDHEQVSTWATSAWRALSADIELLYATMTRHFVDEYRAMHDELGLFADCCNGSPAAVASTRIALECSLSHAELVRKRTALAGHDSQTAGLSAAIGEETYFRWWRRETFRTPTASELAGHVDRRCGADAQRRVFS